MLCYMIKKKIKKNKKIKNKKNQMLFML